MTTKPKPSKLFHWALSHPRKDEKGPTNEIQRPRYVDVFLSTSSSSPLPPSTLRCLLPLFTQPKACADRSTLSFNSRRRPFAIASLEASPPSRTRVRSLAFRSSREDRFVRRNSSAGALGEGRGCRPIRALRCPRLW